jgi:hypothetical protein
VGDRILGFTAFGAVAGEDMAVAQVAMAAGCRTRLCGTPS